MIPLIAINTNRKFHHLENVKQKNSTFSTRTIITKKCKTKTNIIWVVYNSMEKMQYHSYKIMHITKNPN